MSVLKDWFNKISHLGDKEYFDEFERTSNILINQIQLLICVWLLFFFLKDLLELNPDYRVTLLIFIVLSSFFLIRSKISYLAAVSFQLAFCLFAISLEYYTHNLLLRVEPLYVVVILLASLLLPSTKSKVFFVLLTFFSYFAVRYIVSNFPLIMQSDLSSEDNYLLFVFATIMVVIITLRYFHLIKRILSDQGKLLEVLKSKNKELERFAYITSHDLKQPLRNIGSFAGLLRRTINDPSKVHKKNEYLEQIESSTNRMKTLIEEILSFSKIDKTEIVKEEINLKLLLEEYESSHSEYLKERNAQIQDRKSVV